MTKRFANIFPLRRALGALISFAGVLYMVYWNPAPLLAGGPPPATVTLDQDLPEATLPSSLTAPPPTPTKKAIGPKAAKKSNKPGAKEKSTTSDWRLVWFPSQDPFTPLLADPRQPTSSGNFFMLSNEAYGQFTGNFGADIGILRVESTKDGINRSFQVGVMGAAFNRFALVGPNTFLQDADFVIGIPITFRIGRFSTRVFFYHESSHTGYDYDSYFNINQTDNFGQEILQIIPSWDITPNIRIYGGAAYRVIGLYYYPTFGDSLILIGGFEVYSPQIEAVRSRAYLAFNLESKGINGYTPSTDLQAGLLFHQPKSYFQVRPAIDFFNGYSQMGDFLFDKEQYVALGVYFDF